MQVILAKCVVCWYKLPFSYHRVSLSQAGCSKAPCREFSSFGRYAPTVNVGGSRRLFLVNISNASYLSLVKRLFRFGNKKNPQQRYEQYLKRGEKQQKNQTVFFTRFQTYHSIFRRLPIPTRRTARLYETAMEKANCATISSFYFLLLRKKV